MSTPEQRTTFNVGAWKIAYEDRDVAHAVITDEDDRGFFNIIGADTPDDDPKFPIGSKTTYTVELTEAEVERFLAASNCRYVEEVRHYDPAGRSVGRLAGTADVLAPSTLAWQRSRYVDLSAWHGRDVRVAVLDSGTTSAMRTAMGYTLIAQANLTGQSDPFGGHGTVVASTAVPVGGRLLDGKIGTPGTTDSWFAAGVSWAVDNGAKVINASYAGTPGGSPNPTEIDAFEYARDNGNVQIVLAAGNGNTSDLGGLAAGSRLFSNVHSSIAFDEATDRRGVSNYHADASGCGPGVDVVCVGDDGNLATATGTSLSAPAMAHLLARALTGGQFTTTQVGAAFRNNARDTGAGASQQGRGAWDLHLALASLGAVQGTPTVAGPYTSTVVDTRGAAGFSTSMVVTLAPTVVPGDMQLVFLVASYELDTLTGTAGWQVIADVGWNADDDGKTRVRVLARTYTEGDPTSLSWGFNGEAHDVAFGTMTLRGALGIDPNDFVPIARFDDSGSISTVSVLPNTTNDLQICLFAQRQGATAPTASLSTPTGLTSQALIRPASTPSGFGYAMRLATRQLAAGARTPTYTSTSNDSTGTWVSVALTVPSGFVEPPPPPPPPQQELPQGATAGAVAFLPCA